MEQSSDHWPRSGSREERREIGFHLIGTRKEMELGTERGWWNAIGCVKVRWARSFPIGHVILISPRHNSLGTNILVCAQIFEARA